MVPIRHERKLPADYVCNTCLESRFALDAAQEKRDAQFAAAVAAGKEEQFTLQKVMEEEFEFFLQSRTVFMANRRTDLGESEEEAANKWAELLKAEQDKLEDLKLEGLRDRLAKLKE
jgi:hypothetical protein